MMARVKRRCFKATVSILIAQCVLFFLWKTRQLLNQVDNNQLDVSSLPINDYIEESKKLYLSSKYLRAHKLAFPALDSKTAVDRPTKQPLDQVLAALRHLNETNPDEIRSFVFKYLDEPGSEIVAANLTDWVETPRFVESIKDDQLREFAIELNRIWRELYKQVDRLGDGCISSHLPMKHPFVVPGGRFRELYYWDTYWTIEGLLTSGMFDTVQKMLENFMSLIEYFGFVPNGTRVYYLNRSQPPLFSHMVMKYYETSLSSPDLSTERKLEIEKFVLGQALPFMIKEHEFWMRNRSVEFVIDKKLYKLNIYKASTDKPRPESYFEDIRTAQSVNSKKDRRRLFSDLASAAESGYDFSSRWLKDKSSLYKIQTSNIVPVDLNSFLYKSELVISDLCRKKRDMKCARSYKLFANRRKYAINKLLWLPQSGFWSDFNIKTAQLDDTFYVSNLSPLWYDILPPDSEPGELIDKFSSFFFMYEGGVPVSWINSTQQWDFPNVWAPHIYNLVNFIDRYNPSIALKLAKNFFNSVYLGWKTSSMIYEKYNAIFPGHRGDGGEYLPQSGFGWTNGVTLHFLDKFKDDLVF